MFIALKKALSGKRRKPFSRIKQSTFEIRRGKPGSLVYYESGNTFLINVSEGDGYSILVEDMGAVDLRLDTLPITEKLQIARNVRDALRENGIDVEVIYDHRPVWN